MQQGSVTDFAGWDSCHRGGINRATGPLEMDQEHPWPSRLCFDQKIRFLKSSCEEMYVLRVEENRCVSQYVMYLASLGLGRLMWVERVLSNLEVGFQ